MKDISNNYHHYYDTSISPWFMKWLNYLLGRLVERLPPLVEDPFPEPFSLPDAGLPPLFPPLLPPALFLLKARVITTRCRILLPLIMIEMLCMVVKNVRIARNFLTVGQIKKISLFRHVTEMVQ